MPSLAKGYVQSILQGLRMLPQLQKLNKPKDPFEVWLAEQTGQAFDVLGGEGVGGGMSAVGPLGQALIEKKIGRDIDWPEEETASWQEKSFEALNQAIQAGVGETRGVIESGQASPELLRALDMAGGKFFKNLVWPEEKEKTPKAPTAEETKRAQFRQWKELGDIPGFERTPEQELEFEYLDIVKGLGKKKGGTKKESKPLTLKELQDISLDGSFPKDVRDRAKIEILRFQDKQVRQFIPGYGLSPKTARQATPVEMESGGMATPGFETVTEEVKGRQINYESLAKRLREKPGIKTKQTLEAFKGQLLGQYPGLEWETLKSYFD